MDKYRDENGHWTTKENDGGKCTHEDGSKPKTDEFDATTDDDFKLEKDSKPIRKLSDSDVEIVEDAIYWVNRQGKVPTINNIIDQINEDMYGFLGDNKPSVIAYLKKKGFVDSNEDNNAEAKDEATESEDNKKTELAKETLDKFKLNSNFKNKTQVALEWTENLNKWKNENMEKWKNNPGKFDRLWKSSGLDEINDAYATLYYYYGKQKTSKQ